jgi:predicted transcriptional regulator
MVLLVVPFGLYYLVLRSVERRKMARKPTDTAHLNLRYPEALRRRLERAAMNSGRSMNTEIVERLEQSFRREDFEKIQDAINEGMLKVMGVVADVARQMPPSVPRFGLLDLLTPEQTAQVFERPISTDKEEQSKWGEWPKSTDKEEQPK